MRIALSLSVALFALLASSPAHSEPLERLLRAERGEVFAPADEPKLGAWRVSNAARALTPLGAWRQGFYRGLGVAGITGSVQILYHSVGFFRIFHWAMKELEEPCDGELCRLGDLGASIGSAYAMMFGISLAISGTAAAVGGAYLVNTNGGPPRAGAALQRLDRAGYLKGLGLGMLLTGALNVGLGGLFVGIDQTVVYAEGDGGKAVGVIVIALGSAEVVAGGVMALVGHSRVSRLLKHVSVAPMIGPGLGGALVAGQF